VEVTSEPTPEPFFKPWMAAAIVFALALLLNLLGNGRVTLWDRDEPRYAQCTREMRASGDWIHPTFNGLPRYDKPVLIYWLMLAGTYFGGDNPFGARLVSALAGAATCVLVWQLGKTMLGARAGFLAGLVLATAPIMVVESKLATTDATLTFWIVACQACLWRLTRGPSGWAAGAFWVILGLATLTKGPIGPALIACAGLASWWWGGPTACWSRLYWKRGLLGFILLVAPWFVAVGLVSHGEFFRVAMGYHVLRRMTHGVEQHGAFPGYYIVTSLATFHPWSALLPAAIWGAWTRRRARPDLAFLLGWIVGPLILLECVRTKLVHYYLPAYPACALLVAWLIEAVAAEEVNLRRWMLGRLSLGLLGGVGIGATAVLGAAAVAVPGPTRWPCVALALVLGTGTLIGLERFHNGATRRAAATLIAAWAVLMALAGAWLLPSAERYRYSRIVAERLTRLAAQYHATPMLGSFAEPSVVYAMGKPIAPLRSRADLLEHLRHSDAVVSALLPDDEASMRADPAFEVDVPDQLSVFNFTKGKTETLRFALIRARDSALAQRQKTLVE
jgi:4-amino-4-deoxy-L-arabinose transferase-like glycosyltransferase